MFNWFGRKSAPEAMACAHAPPPWLAGAGDEGFARGYEAQLSEVYRTNPVGLRSVRLVAGAIGGLVVESAGGEAEQAGAAALAKSVLEGVSAALLLHGNAFVQLIADSHGAPRELALLRPERVSIACDERGQAAAYVYRLGGKAVRIAARDALRRRQVAHIRALNPGDDHLGLGCLDAGIAAASIHNRASRWNKALLDNAARPSGALSYEPGDGANLSGEQFDRLKAELAEQFAGATNAGRPLLLDGGLKWQAMALSPAEMDFVALKESAARDIALAFGVPPVLVGLPGDATYANAREAGRALYRQTVLPMAERILAELSALLSDWMGEVVLTIDTDQTIELAEDRAKLWEQVRGADFLNEAEKRAMLGFDA
jgi:HK97 family phage portal protein